MNPRVVYDCNVFVQALVNRTGPAGACVQHVLDKHVTLFLSPIVLDEVRDAPNKRTPARLGVTPERTAMLIDDLLKVAVLVPAVVHVFDYPRDPDDAHYVDLAAAADARLIISRDRDLLDLSDVRHPDGTDFRTRFPNLRILDPAAFLRERDASNIP